MNPYVEAGYSVVLVTVVLYGAGLSLQRRRLARSASAASGAQAPASGASGVPESSDGHH